MIIAISNWLISCIGTLLFIRMKGWKKCWTGTEAADKLHWLEATAQRLEYPLYLIIDGYDNFTNVILSEHGQKMFHNLTHCDFFLLPDRQRYPDIAHSYILELKYTSRAATDEELAVQAEEGRRQLLRHSEDGAARRLAEGTKLHRLLLQFRGWDMVRCEEV